MAVNKPAGLLVHRSNIDKHETTFLLQNVRDHFGKFVYPIHRLDKPTSGIILFAFSSEVAAAIQEQMETNKATKEYLLVCRGYTPASGTIEHPLKPIDDFKNKRRKNKLERVEKPAQEAITEYQQLSTLELPICIDKYPCSRYSLVKAQIITGRKHQIRRHFKHISHPIIGCPKYGKSTHNRYFASELNAPRLLLHASSIQMQHPINKTDLSITARPDNIFERIVSLFNYKL